MGRTINLTVGEKTYVLEFTRRTLLLASDIEKEITNKTSNYENYLGICKLARTGFLMHHPDITQEEVNNIVDGIDDLEGFIKALGEIMRGSVDVVETEKKGNSHWEVN